MSARLLGWFCVLLLSGTGCSVVIRVPPPATPDKIIPEVINKADPPHEGQGTVIIDATNGPAQVEVVVSALTVGATTSALTKTLCATTPCAVNLPYGSYDLVFGGKKDEELASTDAVQIGRTPSVFRHTMGSVRSSPGLLVGGMSLVVLGSIAALTGALLVTTPEAGTADWATLGVGVGATAVGAVMTYYGRTKVQPGSSVQWTPDGATPATPEPQGGRQVLRVTPNGFAVSFD
jgi:hypothetical protein